MEFNVLINLELIDYYLAALISLACTFMVYLDRDELKRKRGKK